MKKDRLSVLKNAVAPNSALAEVVFGETFWFRKNILKHQSALAHYRNHARVLTCSKIPTGRARVTQALGESYARSDSVMSMWLTNELATTAPIWLSTGAAERRRSVSYRERNSEQTRSNQKLTSLFTGL